jgi:hypothetical protein
MSEPKKHIEEAQIATVAEQILAGKRSDIDAVTLQHLEDCAACAAELVTVMELMEEDPMEQSVPKNKAIPRIYWFGIGIAALIIIGFFVFPYLSDKQTNPTVQIAQQNVAVAKDTTIAPIQTPNANPLKQEIQQPVSTENTKPQFNKDFESQILEVQSAYRSEDFKLISPYYLSNTQHKKLQWQSGDEEFLIEWWSIDAELLKEQTTSEKSIEIPRFETGIYYFKLLNSDYDLLAVGRLTVE